jgi:hypothetical protein
VGAGPAAAVDTPEHGAEEIASIVHEGQQDMNGIASALQGQIAGLSDQAAVGEAEDAALTSVESIWAAARSAVDEITTLYPGELGQIGGEAKQQLQDARQTARSTISELVDEWAPPAPATTTTTKPPTTTTTSTTTTTTPTTPASDGAGPGSNSGGGPEDQGGATRVPPRTPQPSGPSNDGSGAQDVSGLPGVPGSVMVLELAALTPDQPFTVSSEAISSLLAAQDTSATAAMAAMLDTVLSPAVVDLVLSPLLILEILLRTLVDGGSSLIGPLTMFALAAMALFAYDRFAKRTLSVNPI